MSAATVNAAEFQSARRDVGLQASWQLAALLRVLGSYAKYHHNDEPEFDMVVAAMAPRLADLNFVMMAALSDSDGETPDELT